MYQLKFGQIVPVWPFVIAGGVICSVLFWFFTRKEPDRPPRIYELVYTLLALFMSVVWIYITASELVMLLEAEGVS